MIAERVITTGDGLVMLVFILIPIDKVVHRRELTGRSGKANVTCTSTTRINRVTGTMVGTKEWGLIIIVIRRNGTVRGGLVFARVPGKIVSFVIERSGAVASIVRTSASRFRTNAHTLACASIVTNKILVSTGLGAFILVRRRNL